MTVTVTRKHPIHLWLSQLTIMKTLQVYFSYYSDP